MQLPAGEFSLGLTHILVGEVIRGFTRQLCTLGCPATVGQAVAATLVALPSRSFDPNYADDMEEDEEESEEMEEDEE